MLQLYVGIAATSSRAKQKRMFSFVEGSTQQASRRPPEQMDGRFGIMGGQTYAKAGPTCAKAGGVGRWLEQIDQFRPFSVLFNQKPKA